MQVVTGASGELMNIAETKYPHLNWKSLGHFFQSTISHFLFRVHFLPVCLLHSVFSLYALNMFVYACVFLSYQILLMHFNNIHSIFCSYFPCLEKRKDVRSSCCLSVHLPLPLQGNGSVSTLLLQWVHTQLKNNYLTRRFHCSPRRVKGK